MSNIGWNFNAGGAERPIQPTPPPPLPPAHQNIVPTIVAHPTSQAPPSYNSIYPQVPTAMPPSAPYSAPPVTHVLQPQQNIQTPGPGTSSTFSNVLGNLSQMQNMLPQQLQNAVPVLNDVQSTINHVASGFSGNPYWRPASEGQLPPGAVIGGHEIGGEKLYVARARYGGALIPGKLVPSHRCAYVSWGGREHSVKHYEVLCNISGRWISGSRGTVPAHALPGGTSEQGETLYIGRANHKGTQTIGKLQPSHKLCYIPYAGKEIGMRSYEVFVPNN
ncbi:uncharacterized protein LOC132260445 [Phlebotomus argentipes]|uniref:uncharacterized protein LOC132260445 n=1 Tax=Phlebotomus argentipes TaxID=94469 RepID=UPI0028933203|nr:uncharacterized protein LOC132260445 [Phlebotomus argentipes]